jgi:hypothetical protein
MTLLEIAAVCVASSICISLGLTQMVLRRYQNAQGVSFRRVERSIRRDAKYMIERLRELAADVQSVPPVEPVEEDGSLPPVQPTQEDETTQ